MKKINSEIGWHFDNSYVRLPKIMSSKLLPVPVSKPELIIINYELSKELGLDFSNISQEQLSLIFSGNLLPKGSESIAQAYAGHQFGYFTILGDGRAILLGEHITPNNKRVDVQFKGSGKTPYSRGGDGRAALGPMLREYIVSEAINSLNIPTTRSLAVVKTGENVIREKPLPGAILTRVAASHLRVGTFQYAAVRNDLKTLKILVDYGVDRHYPNLKGKDNLALNLLKSVMKKQIELVTHWMRVGFIHGVMNTDNMTISGETIDYGPCAFMDIYNPETVFSSIDHDGRYAYFNQPGITKWNLMKFAETLLPLINEKKEKAIITAQEVIDSFGEIYEKEWTEMMKKKLGLFGIQDKDKDLIKELLIWMYENKSDYTNTFISLMNKDILKQEIFKNKEFITWYKKWQARLIKNKKEMKYSLHLMGLTNPLVIPRNYKIEEALNAASINKDLKPMNSFLNVLKKPYKSLKETESYQSLPPLSNKKYQTFCGT